jgi:hypothetical protein
MDTSLNIVCIQSRTFQQYASEEVKQETARFAAFLRTHIFNDVIQQRTSRQTCYKDQLRSRLLTINRSTNVLTADKSRSEFDFRFSLDPELIGSLCLMDVNKKLITLSKAPLTDATDVLPTVDDTKSPRNLVSNAYGNYLSKCLSTLSTLSVFSKEFSLAIGRCKGSFCILRLPQVAWNSAAAR